MMEIGSKNECSAYIYVMPWVTGGCMMGAARPDLLRSAAGIERLVWYQESNAGRQ